MNVKELADTLARLNPEARVHLEVIAEGHRDLGEYGHAISVSMSQPGVLVISNRNRIPENWPANVSLTYECPSCGGEVDIREAEAL